MYENVLWSDEITMELYLAYMLNPNCDKTLKFLITLNTPQPCCGEDFPQQGQGGWSTLMGRWVKLNTGQFGKKTLFEKKNPVAWKITFQHAML